MAPPRGRPPPAPAPPPFSFEELGRAGDLGALAHYADAELYASTYATRRHDVAWYVREARKRGGPVLEYGVGTGRVAVPMARAGLEVVGVDLAATMLEVLEARLAREPPPVRARVTTHRGDLREVRLGRRFPLVTAPFNLFLHLYTWKEARAFLERVREHLADGGTFLFDVSVPQPADLCRDPERRYGAPPVLDPRTGRRCRYHERFRYDPLRQLLLITMEYEPEDGTPGWTVPLTHRQWFPQELLALLDEAGFRSVRLTADFGDRPPDESVDSLVLCCAL